MNGMNRRAILGLIATTSLTGAFVEKASAQGFPVQQIARDLMSMPLDRWDPDFVSGLTRDQAGRLDREIRRMKGSVMGAITQDIRNAAEAAQGPTLEDKIAGAQRQVGQNFSEQEAMRQKQVESSYRFAREQAREGFVDPYVDPGYTAEMAWQNYRRADNHARSMALDAPRRMDGLSNEMNNAAQRIIDRENEMASRVDPQLAFAPPAVTRIIGAVAQGRLHPDRATQLATKLVDNYYSGALSMLPGGAAAPSVAQPAPSGGPR